MKTLDILAFGAHPDDVELACSGTLIKSVHRGARVGMVTLTKAELGTRGSAGLRNREFAQAAKIIGAEIHASLDLPDGALSVTQEARMAVIRTIREYQPRLVLLPYWEDRHPDHGYTSKIVEEASFLSGLKKIDTNQEPFRPGRLIYYIAAWEFKPDFIVDISDVIEQKKQAIRAYSSQVHNQAYQEKTGEDETWISSARFWDFLMNRAAYYGNQIGKKYGEPFKIRGFLEVKNLLESFGDNVY